MYLDQAIIKEILMLTCDILHNKFYYDKDALARFLEKIERKIVHDYKGFADYADQETLTELKYSFLARKYFTCYFVSANLHDVMVEQLHFTEQELNAFEAFLPKVPTTKACNLNF